MASRKALTQQVLMTMMWLRLNLSGQDLTYQFSVHSLTISRTCTFINVIEGWSLLFCGPIEVFYTKQCPWTSEALPNLCCNYIERPSNVLARVQTFSSYKHHNTVKYLIGIIPQGTVCFILDGWGGHVSNKHLTENSGLLNHLIPGETILADRGFDIEDSVGIYCARVSIPAFTFTKGKQE